MNRRETLGWPVSLSLALHLTLLSVLLIIPPVRPLTSASEPLTVDVIEGERQAVAEPPAPPLQPAEIPPAPATEVPPPPPVQQTELPPPTPAPAPDVPPPPPVQQAEIPPPTPVPALRKLPPRAPPKRAAASVPVNPSPASATDGQNAASRASGDAAWTGKLKQWWDQHSFYPQDASRTNAGGNVKVHIVIAPDGQVTSIEVVRGSGLSVLDAAAVAVFRNAHLPPFPPGSPAPPGNVVVTLHYRPADGGG